MKENVSEQGQRLELPQTELRAADSLIFRGSCLVTDILVAADGANGDVDIYDGEGTNDARKFHIEALSGTTHSWNSRKGTHFRKGLYIDVNATTTIVSITFIPWEYRGRSQR